MINNKNLALVLISIHSKTQIGGVLPGAMTGPQSFYISYHQYKNVSVELNSDVRYNVAGGNPISHKRSPHPFKTSLSLLPPCYTLLPQQKHSVCSLVRVTCHVETEHSKKVEMTLGINKKLSFIGSKELKLQ